MASPDKGDPPCDVEALLEAAAAEREALQKFSKQKRSELELELSDDPDRIRHLEWDARRRADFEAEYGAAHLAAKTWLAHGPPAAHPGAATAKDFDYQQGTLEQWFEMLEPSQYEIDRIFDAEQFLGNPLSPEALMGIVAAGCPKDLWIVLYLMGFQERHGNDRFTDEYADEERCVADEMHDSLREWAEGGGRAIPVRDVSLLGPVDGRPNSLFLLGPAAPGAGGYPPLREYTADAPALEVLPEDFRLTNEYPDEFLWWRWDDVVPEKKDYVDRAIAWARECTRRGSPYFYLMYSSEAKGERMIEALAWAARRHMELEATRLSLWGGPPRAGI